MIIRNEHYYANDPWSKGISAASQAAPAAKKPSEVIRYTWADHPGNQYFNYKVDVFGFHPYPGVVSLAGGRFKVVAPAYKSYPGWVIDHRWPVITFVDTNGKGYPTSEGIYDWSSRSVGTAYWRGWTATPNMSQFRTITQGLRGEYMLGAHRKV